MSRKSTDLHKNDNHKKSKDWLQWSFVFLLVVAGIYANAHFSNVAIGIRAAVGIVLAVIILAVVGTTTKGRSAWRFIKGARAELRKVVWPTKQETTQTTLLVVVMVVVVALILWGLDSFFFWAVKSIMA